MVANQTGYYYYYADYMNESLYYRSESANARFVLHMVLGHMHLYLLPIIIITGLVTNVAYGTIFSCGKSPRLSLTVFLRGSAIGDTVFLLGLFCTWLGSGLGLVRHTIHWCYFLSMVTQTSALYSAWCRVALSIHTYIEVSTSYLVSAFVAKIILVTIALFSLTIAVNRTLLVDVYTTPDVAFCMPLTRYLNATQMLNRLDLIVNSLLPFIVKLTLVALTLRTMKQTQNYESPSGNQRSRNMMILSRAICVITIVQSALSLPNILLRLTSEIQELRGFGDYKDDKIIVAESCADYLKYLTFGISGLLLPFLWPPYCKMAAKMASKMAAYVCGGTLGCVWRRHVERKPVTLILSESSMIVTIISCPPHRLATLERSV
jgi:hypothetical protein